MERELTVIFTISGFAFPDEDRISQWLEQTAFTPEAVGRYLPDGVAILFRGVASNLAADQPFLAPILDDTVTETDAPRPV